MKVIVLWVLNYARLKVTVDDFERQCSYYGNNQNVVHYKKKSFFNPSVN